MGNDSAKTTGNKIRDLIMSFAAAAGTPQQAFSNTSKVVDQLGIAIVCGDYAEGTMIPLDPDLEEMFGVSRTVIREAKKTLVGKGLLQSKAKVGTRVRPAADWSMFDPDVLRWHASLRKPGPFLEELFEIRLIFEPAAASHVAERSDDIQKLHLTRLAEAMFMAQEPLAFAKANVAFHTAILHLSGNRFLSSLGDMVQTALFSVYLRNEPRDPLAISHSTDQLHQGRADYASLLNAICSGQPHRAEEAMQRIILQAKDAMQ